jgi:hypothetical protein
VCWLNLNALEGGGHVLYFRPIGLHSVSSLTKEILVWKSLRILFIIRYIVGLYLHLLGFEEGLSIQNTKP